MFTVPLPQVKGKVNRLYRAKIISFSNVFVTKIPRLSFFKFLKLINDLIFVFWLRRKFEISNFIIHNIHMLICPSILEKSAPLYHQIIKKLFPYFSYLQIDVADGEYVDNKTAAIDDILKILEKENFSSLKFDFHLMVKNYLKAIKKILRHRKKLTVNNIFIHADLSLNIEQLTHLLYKNIGLVINPQDEILNLARKYNLKKIPFIQIMSVYPGRQRQPFLEETLKKIEQLRLLGYRHKIFLDGGVNDKTILKIARQKFLPDVLCPGSYFTQAKANEISKRIKILKESLPIYK